MDKSSIPDRYRYLASKWKDGSITSEEAKEFADWYNKDQDNEVLIPKQFAKDLGDLEKSMFQAILRKTHSTKRVSLWPRIAVAAAVAIVIFGAGLFYFNSDTKKNPEKAAYANDVSPGKTGATLTLADGKKIRLNEVANGEIAQESGISVTKTTGGQIVYEIKKNSDNNTKINTLTTAKGETYMIILPDHSKVWLNAASSLTYAANLNDHGLRKVSVDGEAYFEVYKDKAHPFIVTTDRQEIEVLGTHFNVNSYEDEGSVKTTLLEGSVKVTSSSRGTEGPSMQKILKPGQQSVLTADARINIKEVNIDDAVAWKEGYFMFNTENLEGVMNKIARWYNVNIVYEDPSLKTETVFGSISKYENISKILKLLERTEVLAFEVNGNTVKVKRKK